MRIGMTVDEGLRLVAGSFVLASVGDGIFVHPGFLAFTAFVGANPLQSAFTRGCPMTGLLERAGFRRTRRLAG
jgi:formyltetrahydrofolate hydrolase